MSAFMVEKEHIDLMVWAATAGPGAGREPFYYFHNGEQKLVRRNHAEQTALGRLLVKANADSVGYRYDEPSARNTYPYEYKSPRPGWSAAEVLMALDSYEYQACETPDYHTSEAAAVAEAIRRCMCRAVYAGYGNSAWSIGPESMPEAAWEHAGA